MNTLFQHFIQQLDDLILQTVSLHTSNDSIQVAKKDIYRQFLTQIRTQATLEGQENSEDVLKMQAYLKQKLGPEFQENQRKSKKRGRPVKNVEAERKLAEWIRSQNRTSFTKKQLKKQLGRFQGRKLKTLTTPMLMRILQRCEITNIEIITKTIGKNAQKPIRAPQIKEDEHEEQSQSKLSYFQQDNRREVDRQFMISFLSQEDSMLVVAPYQFKEDSLEAIFKKRGL